MTRVRPTAYNYALNLLAARPYSSSALRRKLGQKEYSAADADDRPGKPERLVRTCVASMSNSGWTTRVTGGRVCR